MESNTNERDEYGNRVYQEYYTRLEMRFFMMPRNLTEMKLHFDIGNALMHHIFNLTEKGVKFEDKYDNEKIWTFNFKRANENLREVCKEIGIDYRRFVSSGKIKNLRERMSYAKKNKAYLLNTNA